MVRWSRFQTGPAYESIRLTVSCDFMCFLDLPLRYIKPFPLFPRVQEGENELRLSNPKKSAATLKRILVNSRELETIEGPDIVVRVTVAKPGFSTLNK